MQATTHSNFMSLALQLAEQGRLTVSPNPMVGCIIVKDDRIVGQGFHQRAGEPHAEIYALREAGTAARGATAYVSLEPCCHYNRTPPCTDALIRAGIKKVYVACLDPNPLVAGKGIEALREAGITVETGLLEAEASCLNEIFFHFMRHKRPFVIAKWAMSLDGKTITHPHDSKNISSGESRHTTHLLRQQVDAILIGARTAIDDNPLLTVRLDAENEKNIKHPIRLILSSRGELPLDLRLFDSSMPAKTLLATTDAMKADQHKALRDKNIEVLVLPSDEQGRVDLSSLLDELGKKNITSLLVEGGMTIHESFFRKNLVNKIHVYLAPVIIGAMEQKQLIPYVQFSQIHGDFHFEANYYKEHTCSAE